MRYETSISGTNIIAEKAMQSFFSNEEKTCAGEYRYGFNNMEKDNELKGSGNSYDFGARIYDPRIGRWLAVDPLAGKYPGFSDFCFVVNTPIQAIDINGEDVYFIFYDNSRDARKAAKTRERQIKDSPSFDPTRDYVYIVNVTDLGLLDKVVDYCVKNAMKNDFGLTKEVSFFGHHGTDGPQGSIPTSNNSMYSITNSFNDRYQLSPEGWKNINFNFDPDFSIASFYGCHSAEFAERFLVYQPDVKYTMGIWGSAGGSANERGRFIADELRPFSKDVFFASQTGGVIDLNPVFDRSLETLLPKSSYLDSEKNYIPARKPKYNISGNARPELFDSTKIDSQ